MTSLAVGLILILLIALTFNVVALSVLALTFERVLNWERRARRDMERRLPPKPPWPVANAADQGR